MKMKNPFTLVNESMPWSKKAKAPIRRLSSYSFPLTPTSPNLLAKLHDDILSEVAKFLTPGECSKVLYCLSKGMTRELSAAVEEVMWLTLLRRDFDPNSAIRGKALSIDDETMFPSLVREDEQRTPPPPPPPTTQPIIPGGSPTQNPSSIVDFIFSLVSIYFTG